MFKRFSKVIMGLSIMTSIILPLIGISVAITEKSAEALIGIEMGIMVIVIACILQYIVFGKLHPLYLFREDNNEN